MKNRKRQNRFVRAIKKFFLSAFVVVTFTAYALENRPPSAASLAQATGGVMPTPTTLPAANAARPTAAAPSSAGAAAVTPAATAARASSAAPAAAPTATPAPTSTATPAVRSGYRDGTYNGPVVDVNWGYVQVQATIQSGRVSNVQFLQYPSDRRTSVRINSIADPMLDQEAIQAQSANVNIITGATLTSEGFQLSLQDALNQAKS